MELLSVVNQSEKEYEYSWLFYATMLFFFGIIVLYLNSSYFKNQQSGIIMKSFNIKENMKIFEYKPSHLNTLNGIRSLAMVWVILGHAFVFGLGFVANFTSLEQRVKSYFFLFLESGLFAVDVFFFVGGFLVAYSVLRDKQKNTLLYPLAILHRALRLWPAYIVVILIYYSVFIHTNNGPLWSTNE